MKISRLVRWMVIFFVVSNIACVSPFSNKNEVVISGVVREVKFYDGIKDKYVYGFILIPNNRLNLKGIENVNEKSAGELQVTFSSKKITFKEFESRFLNKKVLVKGKIFPSETVHACTNTLLDLEEIKLDGDGY